MIKAKKLAGAICTGLLVLNLVLFSFRIYSMTAFWVVLAILGIASYVILHYLK